MKAATTQVLALHFAVSRSVDVCADHCLQHPNNLESSTEHAGGIERSSTVVRRAAGIWWHESSTAKDEPQSPGTKNTWALEGLCPDQLKVLQKCFVPRRLCYDADRDKPLDPRVTRVTPGQTRRGCFTNCYQGIKYE